MSNYAHLEDDLRAMEKSCIEAFIGPEQLGVLMQLWDLRERPDNRSFEDEHEPAGEADGE